MKWKDSKKAFPDINCECLTYFYLPTKCKICGADRSKNNWKEGIFCEECKEDIDAKGGLPWQIKGLIVCYDCFKKLEEEKDNDN